jgi:hypothetical protein
VEIRQQYRWDSLDRARLAIEGDILIFPVLAALDVAWYVVRNVKIRKRPSAASRVTESP